MLYIKNNVSAAPVLFYSGKAWGEFARPLAPGTYTLVVNTTGYAVQQVEITVPSDGSGVVQGVGLTPV